MNLSLNERFGEELRFTYICRRFLLESNFIKMEDLAEELNVSVPSVNNDMRLVRKNLRLYGITIQSTPYYGMKLVGEEMAIRSCMLDFFNLYDFSGESLFKQDSLEQYQFSMNQILTVQKRVQQSLNQGEYILTDSGFKRVVLYLLIAPMRSWSQLTFSFSEEEIVKIKSLKEYCFAQEIAWQGIEDFELLGLTIFILGNSEVYNLAECRMLDEIVPETRSLFATVWKGMEEKIQIRLTDYPEIHDYLLQFFYKLSIRRKYHIFESEVPRSILNLRNTIH